ncbi:MAG TPA: hypothetical protein ENH91_02050 [Leeuwenhoekiella sp.]|nr:hypothetical protein [Leeuwenhoekiella sp.]
MQYIRYELIHSSKDRPVKHPNSKNWDGKIFRYDYSDKQTNLGTEFTVTANVFFDDKSVLFYIATKSIYLIPAEQTVNLQGEIPDSFLSELIYQHWSRDVDTIFSHTQGRTLLTVPVIQEILDGLVRNEN